MDEATERLALPLLASGQAQKEMTHNEALALLDLLVQPVVEAVAVDVVPAAPVPGEAWGVGAGAAGAWAGHAGAIAGWTGDGWRFAGPIEAMVVWSRADAAPARWTGTAWSIGEIRGRQVLIDGERVLGARGPAVPDPTGGTTIDAEARAAITDVLAALRTHGLIAS